MTADYPDWAIAELAAHAREHADTMRRIRRDEMWLRLWETRVKNARDTSPFGLRYGAKLDAAVARLDAEQEAEATR